MELKNENRPIITRLKPCLHQYDYPDGSRKFVARYQKNGQVFRTKFQDAEAADAFLVFNRKKRRAKSLKRKSFAHGCEAMDGCEGVEAKLADALKKRAQDNLQKTKESPRPFVFSLLNDSEFHKNCHELAAKQNEITQLEEKTFWGKFWDWASILLVMALILFFLRICCLAAWYSYKNPTLNSVHSLLMALGLE